MRGLARDPEQRFATARDMALALEQTIGLASPYEVGEWVESVAAEEVARRARMIAEIESASMTASAPRIGLAPQPAEAPHSQVSSISVSRPAISTPAPQKARRFARAFAVTAALLAVVGILLGSLALQEKLTGGPHQGAANEVARDGIRGFTVLKPPSSLSKLNAAAAAAAAAEGTKLPPVVRQPPPPPPPVTTKPKVNPACDPPFTIDPATGRKKYKIECLK